MFGAGAANAVFHDSVQTRFNTSYIGLSGVTVNCTGPHRAHPRTVPVPSRKWLITSL